MPIVDDVVKKSVPGVVRPTLLYINSKAVIPAKAGIQRYKYRIPGQARNDNLSKGIYDALHWSQ